MKLPYQFISIALSHSLSVVYVCVLHVSLHTPCIRAVASLQYSSTRSLFYIR